MNIYIKRWHPDDCEPELIAFSGVRFGKHAVSKDRKYRAWHVDFFGPEGILEITLTNSHKGFFDHWKREWTREVDWQLFK